jgi:hypothetical protein
MTVLNNLHNKLYDLQYFLKEYSWAEIKKIDNVCDVYCLCCTEIMRHQVCDIIDSVYTSMNQKIRVYTDMNFKISNRTDGGTMCKI